MKILIIHKLNGLTKIDGGFLNLGCGGAETWLIKLAEEFKNLDVDTTICTNTIDHIEDGITWISQDNIDYILSQYKYDLIIISRIYSGYIDKIEKYNSTDNIIIQLHDDIMWNHSTNSRTCYVNDTELHSVKVKKIAVLSDFHKNNIHFHNGIPVNLIEYIPNGIDEKDFSDIDFNRENDHRILVSSQFTRSTPYILNTILPIVKTKISDFGVDIAAPEYSQIPEINCDSVSVLGHLSKTELYKQMAKHACWFYPSTFPETFCITALETAMSGNDLILSMKYGPATTFKEFGNEIGLKSQYGTQEFDIESASRIIFSIMNYEKTYDLRCRIRDYISLHYTWNNVAKKYLKLMEEIKNG